MAEHSERKEELVGNGSPEEPTVYRFSVGEVPVSASDEKTNIKQYFDESSSPISKQITIASFSLDQFFTTSRVIQKFLLLLDNKSLSSLVGSNDALMIPFTLWMLTNPATAFHLEQGTYEHQKYADNPELLLPFFEAFSEDIRKRGKKAVEELCLKAQALFRQVHENNSKLSEKYSDITFDFDYLELKNSYRFYISLTKAPSQEPKKSTDPWWERGLDWFFKRFKIPLKQIWFSIILFWLAFMAGTIFTGNPAVVVIGGATALSLFFVIILPFVIPDVVFGRDVFDQLEADYQFGNDVYRLSEFPSSPIDAKYFNAYIFVDTPAVKPQGYGATDKKATAKTLYYINAKGEPTVVLEGDKIPLDFNYLPSDQPTYFTAPELKEFIEGKGGQLQPGAPHWYSKLLNYQFFKKPSGIWSGFQKAINIFIQFLIGIIFLNTISINIARYFYKKNGVKKDKAAKKAAKAAAVVLQKSALLNQYEQAEENYKQAKKNIPPAGPSASVAGEAKESDVAATPIPPLKPSSVYLPDIEHPPFGEKLRIFVLTLFNTLLKFAFTGLMLIVIALHIAPTATGFINFFDTSVVAGSIFVALSVLYSLYNTYKESKNKREKADRLNKAENEYAELVAEAKVSGDKIDETVLLQKAKDKHAARVAEVSELQSQVLAIQTEIAPLTKPSGGGTAEAGVLPFPDATDLSNLEKPKDPGVQPSFLEKMFTNIVVATVLTLAGYVIDSLYFGRALFLPGTDVTTQILQFIPNLIFSAIGLGEIAQFAKWVIIGLVIGYGLLHAFFRHMQAKADKQFEKTVALRDNLPWQKTCLEKQLRVLHAQKTALLENTAARSTRRRSSDHAVLTALSDSESETNSLYQPLLSNEEKSEAASSANVAIPNDAFPPAELSNKTLQTDRRHRFIYGLARVALILTFAFLAAALMPIVPSPLIYSKLIFSICIPLIAASMVALIRYLYYESNVRNLLTPQERKNTLILGIGLFVALTSLLLVYSGILPATISLIAIGVNFLVMAFILGITFKRDRDITYAGLFPSAREEKFKALIEQKLTPQDALFVEYFLDDLISALNPNDQGEAFDRTQWAADSDDKNSVGEQGLLLTIKQLMRIRSGLQHGQGITDQDWWRIDDALYYFKSYSEKKLNANQPPIKTKTHTETKKLIDYACMFFMFLVTGAIAILSAVFKASIGVYWPLITIIVPLVFYFVFVAYSARPPKASESSEKNRPYIIPIFIIALLATFLIPTLCFTLPSVVGAWKFLSFLAIIPLLISTQFLREKEAEGMRSVILKIFSPRLWAGLVLVALLAGAIVAPILVTALSGLSPVYQGLSWLLSFAAIQIIYRSLLAVGDIKSSITQKISSFFWRADMVVLSAAAVGLPILSGLLLFQKMTFISPFTSMMVAASALALTFVILKFLLPKIHKFLAAEQRRAGAQDTRSDADIDYLWQKVSLGFAGAIFAAACGLSFAGASILFPALSGVCLVGLGAGLYFDRRWNNSQVEKEALRDASEIDMNIEMGGAPVTAASKTLAPHTQATAANKARRRGAGLFDHSASSESEDEGEGVREREGEGKRRSDSNSVQPL